MTLGNYVNLSRHMANWNLIRGLLYLYLLIRNKFALLDLQNQLALDVVLLAAHTWALEFWGERFLVNDLIHFHATSITGVDRHLHAWLDVTAAGHNTFYGDERANRLGFYFSHWHVMLLTILTTWNNDQVVLSLEIGWDAVLVHAKALDLLIVAPHVTLVDHERTRLLVVEAALLHYDVE